MQRTRPLVAARADVRLIKPGARMSWEKSKIGEVFSHPGEYTVFHMSDAT